MVGDDNLSYLLVEIAAAPPSSLFERARSKRDRLRLMEEFYASRKRELVIRLSAIDGVTTDDLSSGAGLIVRGPERVLNALLNQEGPLSSSDLRVAPPARFDPTG